MAARQRKERSPEADARVRGRHKDADGQEAIPLKRKIPAGAKALMIETQNTEIRIRKIKADIVKQKGVKETASAKLKEAKVALEDEREHLEECVSASRSGQGDLIDDGSAADKE